MWIQQQLDLVRYEVTLETMCFKSLSECRRRIYEAFQTVRPVTEKDLFFFFFESLSACSWHTKREADRRGAKLTRRFVFIRSLWQIPGTTFRKGAKTQRRNLHRTDACQPFLSGSVLFWWQRTVERMQLRTIPKRREQSSHMHDCLASKTENKLPSNEDKTEAASCK